MFHVRWHRQAIDELADLWARADSAGRQAITLASHETEQRLRRNPHAEGESRSLRQRLVFIPPLAIVFRVERDDKTVSVLEVWPSRRRP